MTNKLVVLFVFCIVALGLSVNGNAHDVFQDVLKEQYMLKSFSCKTCHPDSDDRKLRTPFAERIYQVMKPKGLSEKFAVASQADEAAKAKDDKFDDKKGAVAEFEKMVATDFKEAFKTVALQKMSFDEMLKEGLFNGARLDTKAIAAAKEAEEKK